MRPTIKINLTGRQKEAWSYLTSLDDEDVMYGGAKGGGKSYLFCVWLFYWINWLIDFFELTDTTNPLPLGFVGRKQSVDFYNTTLETWKKIIPAELYRIVEVPHKEIHIRGLGKVLYGGLDRRETINKFNSAEYAFYAIDQAEECERKDVSLLEGSLRLTHKGKVPPYKILYTSNPAECFLKEDYYHGNRKGARFVPALYTDNPHLPDNYSTRLDSAFQYDPEMLEAYKKGNWNLLSRSRKIVTSAMMEAVKNLDFHESEIKKIITCDPSLGGDECVILYLENTEIKECVAGRWDDSKLIAAEILALSNAKSCRDIAIDVIGIGEGVVSRCRDYGLNVLGVCSAEKTVKFSKCLNKRADMYWDVRSRFIDKNISYPSIEKLRRQLANINFELKHGVIVIEEKSQIRSRAGESPDYADAFVQGVWAQDVIVRRQKEKPIDANLRGVNYNRKQKQTSYGW